MDKDNEDLIFVSDDEDDDDDVGYNLPQKRLGNISRHTEENTKLLEESLMSEQEMFVGKDSEYVKIIDKSRRAFSTSLDSTKAFEMSLRKPRDGCKNSCIRFRATVYSLWILMFKHHGRAPKSVMPSLFAFAVLITWDLMFTIVFIGHLLNPWSNMKKIGIPFLLLYPGIAVLAPLVGILACFCGSASLLRVMSHMNATNVLANYPLTLIV